MAIYVDDYEGKFRGMVMAHLFADTADELHAFANRIGLRRAWFHQQRSLAHYDVCKSKRQAALELGAIDLPIGGSDWRRVIRRIRKEES